LAISEPCGDFIGEVLSHLSAGRWLAKRQVIGIYNIFSIYIL
jgi:hypothetical protein